MKYTTLSQKRGSLLFSQYLRQQWTNFHNFFTVKFRKDLWRKMELKLSPPLKSVVTLPCKM